MASRYDVLIKDPSLKSNQGEDFDVFATSEDFYIQRDLSMQKIVMC